MKKIILGIIMLAFTFQSNAQDLDNLTYAQAHNQAYFKTVKKGDLKAYVTENNTLIRLGDTITLGLPLVNHGGVKSHGYSNIIQGDAYDGGRAVLSGLAALGGEVVQMYPLPVARGEEAVIVKMKYRHNGNKKRPLVVHVVLASTHGSFGSSGKRATAELEVAIRDFEIIHPLTPMSKELAIAQLKEAKEELDLGIMTQEEFDVIKDDMIKVIRK